MPTLEEIIISHREQHPHAEPVDIYKLAHQATRGIGHLLIADTNDPAASIIEELEGVALEPHDWETVVEPISHRGDFVRIHLRPFLRSGGDPARLAGAMIATAADFPGSVEQLAAHLGELRPILRAQWPEFDHHRFDKLIRDNAGNGFPTVSHSDAFRELYDPHYRVVSLSHLTGE
jgi:hypothetical protein